MGVITTEPLVFSFVSLVILIKSSLGRPLFSLLFHDEIYEAAIL